MGLTLTAFLDKSFIEIRLPNINDSDYDVLLSKDTYNLKSDIHLKLEVINHVWSLYSTDDYEIISERRYVNYLLLKSGCTFGVKTSLGDQLLMMAISTDDIISASYKIDLSRNKLIRVGSKDDNDVIFSGALVSGHHLEITTVGNESYIEDISTNGTFLNSKKISKRSKLSFGDCVYIYGLKIYYYGNILAVASLVGKVLINSNVFLIEEASNTSVDKPCSHKKEYFNRSPRIINELYTEKIEIEGPDKADNSEQRSLISTIGPSFTMVLPMALGAIISTLSSSSAAFPIGLITALGSAIVGVFWGIINFRKEKNQRIKKDHNRFQSYSDYLRKTSDFIEEKYNYNADCLNMLYPSTEQCLKYDDKSVELWNRNNNHSDFLYHRVGLGKMPFQAEIVVPKIRLSDSEDELMQRPGMIKNKYAVLNNVPACIDLYNNRIIGIVGGKNKKGAFDVLKNLVIQIAASNCYTDVKLCFIFDNTNPETSKISFVKWLPHVWSEEKKERYYSENKEEASDIFYSLSNIVRVRAEQAENAFGKRLHSKPHYVLIIDNQEFLEGEPIAKYIFEGREEYGLTTVFLSDTYDMLPNNCQCIVYNTEEAKGIYTPQNMSAMGLDIVFDDVDTDKCDYFARRISGVEVKEIEVGGEIPNSLSFLEMYHVEKVEQLNVYDRWVKNRTYSSMKALVGQKSGGTDCFLDIHEKYHGPHGLVAGTTGSGKSETLQTYILSLAVNFSPNDISFFIIDFKGGGMANLFSDLPHMAGQISNLSGNQVKRAMVSIKSENLRRQRVFTEAGVNNINNYTRMYKNGEVSLAVPHLFIIIDEFAELKKEEPEFMKELISVAQVGRSLGVHLILATQKPSGTVDDNIRSNSRFKLCLRVQDKQDSKDMIGKPDAAYLTQAGRCFLQVGNDEIFELFQSGWSGAVYDEKSIGLQSGIASLIINTGRSIITGSKTTAKRKEAIKAQWLLKIIDIIKRVSEELHYNTSSINSDDYDRENYISRVFSCFAENNVEYVRTVSSEKYLLNLIKLYNSFKEYSDSEMYKNIIESSNHFGIKLPEMKDKSQLEAVVEHICTVANTNGYEFCSKLWLPVMPNRIYLDDMENYASDSKWSLKVNVGMCDDPTNQAQFPYTVDFSENGHLAIYGGVVTGKSTFMQTLTWALIKKYTPEELNFYALDFSNHMLQPFEKDAHCGGIMYETDIELIAKFFYMINGMLSERKKLIRGGSFNQYVRSGNKDCPAVVLMIDNYAAFKEKTDGKYDDILLELSRDGAGFGIYLVISAGGIGINELQSKIADNIKTSIAFGMGDKLKYSDVLGVRQIEILPEEGIKGRGLVVVGSSVLEFQSALCIETDDDYKRSEAISDYCKEYSKSFTGKSARNIPHIPKNPIWSDLVDNSSFCNAISNPDLLPFAYDAETADIVSISLRENFTTLIGGSSRSGRTNALKIMIGSAKIKGCKTVLIDKEDMSLKAFAKKYCDEYITTKQELYSFLKGIIPEFKSRNMLKRKLIADGFEESEIYEKMLSTERVIVFVSSATAFNNLVYTFDSAIGDMHGFVENITEKGSLHNIFFIVDVSVDEYNDAKGRRAFNNMASYRKGIFLGGNVSTQRMFDLSSLPYSMQTKNLKPGEGFITAGYDTEIKQIIVPLSKGMI